MGNATPISDPEAYREQLSRSLDLVDEANLAPVDRDALATGICVARKVGDTLRLPNLQRRQPQAFSSGERILRQLLDAETDLAALEVAELDALLDKRLPQTL